jgi:hypothetical protein
MRIILLPFSSYNILLDNIHSLYQAPGRPSRIPFSIPLTWCSFPDICTVCARDACYYGICPGQPIGNGKNKVKSGGKYF